MVVSNINDLRNGRNSERVSNRKRVMDMSQKCSYGFSWNSPIKSITAITQKCSYGFSWNSPIKSISAITQKCSYGFSWNSPIKSISAITQKCSYGFSWNSPIKSISAITQKCSYGPRLGSLPMKVYCKCNILVIAPSLWIDKKTTSSGMGHVKKESKINNIFPTISIWIIRSLISSIWTLLDLSYQIHNYIFMVFQRGYDDFILTKKLFYYQIPQSSYLNSLHKNRKTANRVNVHQFTTPQSLMTTEI